MTTKQPPKLSKEVWKPVPGINKNFNIEVSSHGHVRVSVRGRRAKDGSIQINTGTGAYVPLDSLIASVFMPDSNKDSLCNHVLHKNGDAADNSLDNLEWEYTDSPDENTVLPCHVSSQMYPFPVAFDTAQTEPDSLNASAPSSSPESRFRTVSPFEFPDDDLSIPYIIPYSPVVIRNKYATINEKYKKSLIDIENRFRKQSSNEEIVDKRPGNLFSIDQLLRSAANTLDTIDDTPTGEEIDKIRVITEDRLRKTFVFHREMIMKLSTEERKTRDMQQDFLEMVSSLEEHVRNQYDDTFGKMKMQFDYSRRVYDVLLSRMKEQSSHAYSMYEDSLKRIDAQSQEILLLQRHIDELDSRLTNFLTAPSAPSSSKGSDGFRYEVPGTHVYDIPDSFGGISQPRAEHLTLQPGHSYGPDSVIKADDISGRPVPPVYLGPRMKEAVVRICD